MQVNLLGAQGVKPLCWTNEGFALVYAQGSLHIVGGGSGWKLCDLPLGELKRLASHSRIASRILRIEPRAALTVGDAALVAWAGTILRVNLQSGKCEVLLGPREGFSDPLYFTRARGCGLLAVWGDYGTNPSRAAVAIRGFDEYGRVRVLRRFEPGSVRHVHGIVSRRVGSGGYYVLTGDMEEGSGIYIATEDFSSVKPLAVGEQRFRAVRGFPTNDGMVYATDSASIENHVFRLYEGPFGAGYSIDDLRVLNGPCIYGGEVEGGYLFTTTVEPDESRSGITSYLSRKAGPGVLTSEATAVLVTDGGLVREVARIKSDGMPLKAFQYGSLQIPAGIAPEGNVWAFARALAGLDGRAVELSWERK